MSPHSDQTGSAFEIVFVALQFFQVAFLWLHDWIPLGRLNNIAAVQSQDSRQRLLVVTAVPGTVLTIELVCCVLFYGRTYPLWLHICLWITYVGIFLGQLRAWWVPYLLVSDPKRAARYQIMFANTHSFLPEHNGITPNTLHIALHLSTAATLAILFVLEMRL